MTKVYGICGDSKCRREVPLKDNFKLVTGKVSIPAGSNTHEGLPIPYPSGFSKSNCIAIGIELNNNYGMGTVFATFYNEGFCIFLSNNSTYGTSISYRIMLMKLD